LLLLDTQTRNQLTLEITTALTRRIPLVTDCYKINGLINRCAEKQQL
jgi:hypothetical protein